MAASEDDEAIEDFLKREIRELKWYLRDIQSRLAVRETLGGVGVNGTTQVEPGAWEKDRTRAEEQEKRFKQQGLI